MIVYQAERVEQEAVLYYVCVINFYRGTRIKPAREWPITGLGAFYLYICVHCFLQRLSLFFFFKKKILQL